MKLEQVLTTDAYCAQNIFRLKRFLLNKPELAIWAKEVRLKKLLFILSYLNASYSGNDIQLEWGEWVYIRTEVFQSHLGPSFYREAIEVLRAAGMLDVNENYLPNVFSPKGEGFSKSYRLPYALREMPEELVLFKRGGKGGDVREDKSEIGNETQQFIFDCLARVTLDSDSFDGITETFKANSKNARFIRAKNTAEKILQGRFNVKAGKNQKRIYHTLTSAPREMRNAVRLDGQKLVEIDVKACQPSLLLKFLDGIPGCEEYGRILREEDFYSFFCTGQSRDLAKVQFCRFAFGEYKRKNAWGEKFTELLPEVAGYIRENSTWLSRQLQDLEAEICIYGVVETLRAMGSFAIPVHDSFMIRAEDSEVVQRIIEAEFRNSFNFTPKVSVKN